MAMPRFGAERGCRYGVGWVEPKHAPFKRQKGAAPKGRLKLMRSVCVAVLIPFKPRVQYYQSQSWLKVGSDVPLVLFGGWIELKLPLLYQECLGCDTAVVRRKHVRRMVSLGTQHRYPPLRQVRDSDVAQVELLPRSVNSQARVRLLKEGERRRPWHEESESEQL